MLHENQKDRYSRIRGSKAVLALSEMIEGSNERAMELNVDQKLDIS